MIRVSEAISREEEETPLPPVSIRIALLEIPLSLLGSFVLGMYVPWNLVLQNTIPGGGDNPAHPSLMRMADDAFFSHLHVAHYAYGFWGGFEAFQFYFPLPYLCGALLSHVAVPNVAL